MSWPLSHEFNEAIQNPRVAFADADLKQCEPVVGATGLPLPRSGNFADVYQLRAPDGREWAVKCFTRPVAGLAERYARVGEALAKAGLPFAITFEFLAEGIRVGGAWRPVVKMEWVEGLLLNQVARESAAKPAVLGALGLIWVRLCKRLRESGVAHADVQHGNALLVPGSRAGAFGVKLIDYDGMWVPALANTPSGESGHPSYQHPARAGTRAYSPDVDRFPHLVIATALRGLAACGPSLWEKYDNGDNLLFTEADFKSPSGSKLMRELWQSGDESLQALVGRLALSCRRPLPQTPWLDQLAPDGEPALLEGEARREAAAALGIALPVPVPLPPEPVQPVVVPLPQPVPTRARAARDEEEEEVDVELAEAPVATRTKGRARKPARRYKPAKSAAGSNTRLLLIAGGLFLLAGGVLAAVLISTNSKPTDTAQQEEPKEQPKQEPKESPSGPREGPKPREFIDPQPEPKDKGSEPVGAPGVWTVRETWRVSPERGGLNPPIFSLDSRLVSQRASTGHVTILDAETGKQLESPPDSYRDGGVVGLDNELFFSGTARGPGGTFSIWDARAGKISRTFTSFGAVYPRGAPSRTAKYLASASVHGEMVFKLRNTQPDHMILNVKLEGREYPWVYYTDDESRVLLAERTGRCRWYKLPSGELDKEWTVEAKEPDQGIRRGHGVRAASGGGSVLAYWGTVGDRGLAVHILDGATGRVLHSIPSTDHPPSLSRDGRLVLVHSRRGQEEFATLVDIASKMTVVEISAPPELPMIRPVLAPDGRSCVAAAVAAGRHALIRYDFVRPGGVAVGPKPPDPVAPRPVGKLEVRPGWAAELPVSADVGKFRVSVDSSLVLIAPRVGEAVAVDAKTGAVIPGASAKVFLTTKLLPLSRSRFTLADLGPAKTIPVVDFRTGKSTPVPGIEVLGEMTSKFVSPDMRYVAVGVASRDEPLPFKLKSASDGKVILEFNWLRGSVHFTADSSRVLLAERNGRCRWFKLPSGELDKEWALERPAVPGQSGLGIIASSPDGSVLLFEGNLVGRDGEYHVIDGRTGRVTRSFKGYNRQFGTMSADGSLVLLSKLKPTRALAADLIHAATGEVVAELVAPAGSDFLIPSILPDGRGAVALVKKDKLMRFDFVAPGAAGKQQPDPVPAGDPLALKPRWTSPTGEYMHRVHLTASGKVVLGGAAGNRGGVALDADTGKPVAAFAEFLKGGAHAFFPLANDRVAKWQLGAKTIHFADEKTGKEYGRQAITDVPRPGQGSFPLAAISPNNQYVAAGWTQSGPKFDNPQPLRVFNLRDKNKEVLKLDWPGGHVYFTADSSRVLVAEHTGRCRWYKLPSGELDAEWNFGAPARWRHDITSVSADGSVLAYIGVLDGRLTAASIDGKTGKVLQRFAVANTTVDPVVSRDGRRIAVPATGQMGFFRIDLADTRSGEVIGRIPTGSRLASVSFSQDGTLLVLATHAPHTVQLFDVPGGAAGGLGAVVPPPPGKPVELKLRWEAEAKGVAESGYVYFDRDGGMIALVTGGVPWKLSAFDARTGKAVGELANRPSNFSRLFPLEKGRFAYQTTLGRDVTVWDPVRNQTSVEPVQPPAPTRSTPFARPSPNGRFLAVGQSDPGPGKEIPETELRVIDTTTEKVVVRTKWRVGSARFTADSSRVLVLDDTGTFRWFKLPGGEVDAQWSFNLKSNGFNTRGLSTSADGGVVLYYGPAPGKEVTHHLLDGKTGAILHSFPAKIYSTYAGSVSDDGRFVMLPRYDGRGPPHTVEFLDIRGNLLVSVKLPDNKTGAVMTAVSWKGGALLLYDRRTKKLTAYDLPDFVAPRGSAEPPERK